MYRILSYINRITPKRERQIAIYGRRMLNDNSAALLDFLIEERYNEKYNIKILVSNQVDCIRYENIKNVKIIRNSVATIWNIITSMRVFHSQGMTVCAVIPCGSQIIFDLWHGSPLKSIGLLSGNKWHSDTDSYFLCASPFMANINKRCFNLSDSQIFIGSNPRNDQMLNPKGNEFITSITKDSKLIIYMPTFRNSKELHRHDSSMDFPILDTDNIQILDSFLENKHIKLIIKPHPYQNDIPLFSRKYKNIIILKNSDLTSHGITLYQMLGHTDALVTDFSSVYFDYLLLDRPIGFVIEDIENYEKNRGYTVDNPLDLMPGDKIKNFNEFVEFIDKVSKGNDDYQNERSIINELCNTYKKPNASKRILDFLGIIK